MSALICTLSASSRSLLSTFSAHMHASFTSFTACYVTTAGWNWRCWFCARLSEPEGSIQFGSVEDVHLTYKAFIYKKFPQPYVFFFFIWFVFVFIGGKETHQDCWTGRLICGIRWRVLLSPPPPPCTLGSPFPQRKMWLCLKVRSSLVELRSSLLNVIWTSQNKESELHVALYSIITL